MPDSGAIPMSKATGFGSLPELLEQRASHSVLHGAFRTQNLPLEILDSRETWIPAEAMMGVFEDAARATGERTFGLDVGEAMSHRDFGLWMEYCASAGTLAEGISRSDLTGRFQQTGASIRLEREGPYAVWCYNPPNCGVVSVQHTDHLIGPMMRFLSFFLGFRIRPVWLELVYPRDPLAHLVEDRFDCPVRFGRGRIGVAFDAALLKSTAPFSSQKDMTRQVTMLDVEASEMKPLYDEPVQSVASILVMRLMGGNSDIEGTAQAAGYGVQTMQRMLRREGTSYREVLEAVRCMRAKALLRETPLSITEIGLSLGYSDHANFTRAFNRWAGCPPNSFRKRRSGSRAMFLV